MAADVLAPCVARTPAAMILTVRMDRSLSYVRKDFNHLCHINVEERQNVNICFMFPLKKLAREGLKCLDIIAANELMQHDLSKTDDPSKSAIIRSIAVKVHWAHRSSIMWGFSRTYDTYCIIWGISKGPWHIMCIDQKFGNRWNVD